MFIENEKEPGIIGFSPDEINLQSKDLSSRLIEACVKTYVQYNLFEMADTKKLQRDLYDLIGSNIIYKEDLRVYCLLSGESINIEVYKDSVYVSCELEICSGIIKMK